MLNCSWRRGWCFYSLGWSGYTLRVFPLCTSWHYCRGSHGIHFVKSKTSSVLNALHTHARRQICMYVCISSCYFLIFCLPLVYVHNADILFHQYSFLSLFFLHHLHPDLCRNHPQLMTECCSVSCAVQAVALLSLLYHSLHMPADSSRALRF